MRAVAAALAARSSKLTVQAQIKLLGHVLTACTEPLKTEDIQEVQRELNVLFNKKREDENAKKKNKKKKKGAPTLNAGAVHQDDRDGSLEAAYDEEDYDFL
jgi:hypothetical protein